jgi:tetratricopeptide (TPR) repeat protein
LQDKGELRRLASKLGVETERVGVTNESLTDEQASETIEHIWTLVNHGRAWEARTVAERLVGDLHPKARLSGRDEDIYRLTQAHHVQAYTRAMNTRISEIRYPLASYHNMGETARVIKDPTLLTIALTYEGDMYNRTEKLDKGIPLLKEALDTAPTTDIAARGNALQLLGRAHFKAGNIAEFEHAMKESEELAGLLTGKEITRGQYGLISVYEEYGKSYALIGEMQKSLGYIQKAYNLGVPDTHWEMVLKTAKVIALVRGGETQAGTTLALECIEQCRKYGTIRLLERIYGVHKYLQRMRKQIGKSDDVIREALDGPVEY